MSAVNVARVKNATQLSAFNDETNGFVWTADKAVDGVVPERSPEVDKCCSASQGNAADNYWEVHLGGMFMVGRINIIGRTDNKPGIYYRSIISLARI
ncbi:hypothetical protein DPMN_159603 [Dreissena polymorpha]|uniref:Uncharacterized protein n=1 Tax=Dreissena polymorpha TaxID=45954 RepID=A0A9D4IN00_DREPO|nr:hypothetical protein DPMN_159603 [Dreissena polymorpha]